MRALLAEDDFNLGTWLCKALAAVAIQVEWVNDGYLADQALRKLHAQGDYDVLILDAGLPGRSGEAAKRCCGGCGRWGRRRIGRWPAPSRSECSNAPLLTT